MDEVEGDTLEGNRASLIEERRCIGVCPKGEADETYELAEDSIELLPLEPDLLLGLRPI